MPCSRWPHPAAVFDRSYVGRQRRRSKDGNSGRTSRLTCESPAVRPLPPFPQRTSCDVPQGGEILCGQGCQACYQRSKSIAVTHGGLRRNEVCITCPTNMSSQQSISARQPSIPKGASQAGRKWCFSFHLAVPSVVTPSRVDRPVVDILATCCLSHTSTHWSAVRERLVSPNNKAGGKAAQDVGPAATMSRTMLTRPGVAGRP